MVVSVLLVLAIIFGFGLLKKTPQPMSNKRLVDELAVWPYEPMPLMTDTEVKFYHQLKLAIPEYPIFTQVQLSRLIQTTEVDDARFWFNRISRMSVDYVVMSTNLQTCLIAIELDDWTHDEQTRKQADIKKDKALASAGIPIMRFHGENIPAVNVLREEVLSVISHYYH